MNKEYRLIHMIVCTFFVSISGYIFYKLITYKNDQQIQIVTATSFDIPYDCKKLGLLGCTPHPTKYLRDYKNKAESLRTITLNKLIDMEYVRDSFNRTFIICKENEINHLIIAYLPIYFVEMRSILNHKFVNGCRVFMEKIESDIEKLIIESIQQTEYTGNVTLIFPPSSVIDQVPNHLKCFEDRIRYLIKQFPRLQNISQSSLKTIAIINNKTSCEDEQLINYLKYEYLYEKPITYELYTTGKERFHKYL